MKTNKIINDRNNIGIYCKIADTFLSKLCGLMLQKEISPNAGLILSESSESVINSSIHMLFMRFNIAVIWLNKDKFVVSKKLAKKWRLAYFSDKPACYIVETHPSQLENFSIGDHISFLE
jgi:uncharacterized membrane protein (UPF0127 family)